MDGQLLNSTYELKIIDHIDPIIHTTSDVNNQSSQKTVVSRVKLKSLRRNQHRSKISCRASNTNLADAPTTTVYIELLSKLLFICFSIFFY